jgi:hypothetical protein
MQSLIVELLTVLVPKFQKSHRGMLFYRMNRVQTSWLESGMGAAIETRRVRTEALKVTTGGLRADYRTLELRGKHPLKDAHAALDAAVLAAYGFDQKKDLLEQLLRLNLDVAARIAGKQPVTRPGVPAAYGDATPLITDDCIKP